MSKEIIADLITALRMMMHGDENYSKEVAMKTLLCQGEQTLLETLAKMLDKLDKFAGTSPSPVSSEGIGDVGLFVDQTEEIPQKNKDQIIHHAVKTVDLSLLYPTTHKYIVTSKLNKSKSMENMPTPKKEFVRSSSFAAGSSSTS